MNAAKATGPSKKTAVRRPHVKATTSKKRATDAPKKAAHTPAKAAKKTTAGAKLSAKAAPPLETLARLRKMHPDAHCELNHKGAFQLLVATVLSAQTTDVSVNKATPKLFERYPDAFTLAKAAPEDVEPLISTLGFFRQKTKSIVGLSRQLVEEHGGEVPRSMEALVALPGVGRKTANVVLGVMWNAPEGVVVDTHVQRISQRLGWTKNTEPLAIERDLVAILPRKEWDPTSHLLIFHGRRICFARKPNCAGCLLNDICPSAFHAENVGRKPPRMRRSA